MRRGVRRPLVALVALVLALVVGYVVKGVDDSPTRHHDPSSSSASSASVTAPSSPRLRSGAVPLSSLPAQAARTVRLIEQGGPFPYPRDDGVVFHNDEHHLPREPDGFYREYTVPTPGSQDRGERRLIRGTDGSLYYTGNHYASFHRVDLGR